MKNEFGYNLLESNDEIDMERKIETEIERKNEFANNQFDGSHFLSRNCRLVFALRTFTILQLGGMSDILVLAISTGLPS
jgi:hypothetical protein